MISCNSTSQFCSASPALLCATSSPRAPRAQSHVEPGSPQFLEGTARIQAAPATLFIATPWIARSRRYLLQPSSSQPYGKVTASQQIATVVIWDTALSDEKFCTFQLLIEPSERAYLTCFLEQKTEFSKWSTVCIPPPHLRPHRQLKKPTTWSKKHHTTTSSRHIGVGGIRLFWVSASEGPP